MAGRYGHVSRGWGVMVVMVCLVGVVGCEERKGETGEGGAVAKEVKGPREEAVWRLEHTKANVNYKGIPLVEVLKDVEKAGRVSIQAQWDELRAAGIWREEVITIRLEGVRLKTVLDYTLEFAGAGKLGWAGYEIDDQGVVVIKIVKDFRQENQPASHLEGKEVGILTDKQAKVVEVIKTEKIQVAFDEVAFEEVLEGIRELGEGFNIFVNWNELEIAGITQKDPVSIPPLQEVSLRKVLQVILDYESRGKLGRAGYDIDEEGIITIRVVGDHHEAYLNRMFFPEAGGKVPDRAGKRNVLELLRNKKMSVEFQERPLREVLEEIRKQAEIVNFMVDWNGLEVAGITRVDPVSIPSLTKVSVRKVLQKVCDYVSGGTLGKAGYDIDDEGIFFVKVVGDGHEAYLNRMLFPEAAGKAPATREKHRVMEALRTKMISVDFQRTPLEEVLEEIRKQTEINNFVIIWDELEVAGIAPWESVTLQLRQVCLGRVLDYVLACVSGGRLGRAGMMVDEEGILEIRIVGDDYQYLPDTSSEQKKIKEAIRAKLRMTALELGRMDYTVKEVFDLLREQTDLNIVVQWNEVEVVGCSPEDKVWFPIRMMSGLEMLEKTLKDWSEKKPGRVGYEIDGERIVVVGIAREEE